jgi:hypothetical protein
LAIQYLLHVDGYLQNNPLNKKKRTRSLGSQNDNRDSDGDTGDSEGSVDTSLPTGKAELHSDAGSLSVSPATAAQLLTSVQPIRSIPQHPQHQEPRQQL